MPSTQTPAFRYRFVALILMTLFSMLLIMATPSAAQAGRLAWLVMDAKTGQVISERNARSSRHPASLTKMMTAYMVFDALDAGRLSMSTPLKVSTRAASEPASKLWLKAGSTITVRDALNAIIVKSANDVSTVIAENLAGSEAAFAKQMTSAARQIGMRDTTFRNAHGLHHSGQVTTAYDMYVLAVALQDRFPEYYPLFSQQSFRWKGQTISHHNPFLGHWRGVDGLKTGYTRASGYNLVTNIRRDGRHLIGIVVGADSSKGRNAKMGELLTHGLTHASTGSRRSALIDIDVRFDSEALAGTRLASLAPSKALRPHQRPEAAVRVVGLRPQPKPSAIAEEAIIFARDPEILKMMLDEMEREAKIEVARMEIPERNRMAFMSEVAFEAGRSGKPLMPTPPLSLPDVEIPTVAVNVRMTEDSYEPLTCLENGSCFVAGVERKASGHYAVSDMSLFALITSPQP